MDSQQTPVSTQDVALLLRRRFSVVRRVFWPIQPVVRSESRLDLPQALQGSVKTVFDSKVDNIGQFDFKSIDLKLIETNRITNDGLDTFVSLGQNTPQPKGSKLGLKVLFAFFVSLSIGMSALLFAPTLYYQFFSSEVVPIKASAVGSPLGGEFGSATGGLTEVKQLPPYDETLPDGNWVIIPRIGVRTEILESVEPEESLKKGVWRVTDFAQPGELGRPMILVAHRFGYKWQWQSNYWKVHTFYLLPELEPGDLVEVISGKRKYVYEIYAGEEAEEISDYKADLILYTCKFLNSPVRHFRYARLLDLQKNTQQ